MKRAQDNSEPKKAVPRLQPGESRAHASSLDATIEPSAFLSAIIESADDAIVSKNLDGIVTSWNQGAERIFGYRAEEIVGKPILLIIPPDRTSEEVMIIERVRRGERVEHFETVRLRKDGLQVNISLTVSPIKDSKGRIVGASKIARDITERKRFEEVLLEERQMRAAAEQRQMGKALEARIRQQRTVAELGLAALQEQDTQKIFDRAVEDVAQTLGVELCKVLELLPGSNEVLLRAGVGWKEGLVGRATVSTDCDSQAGYTLVSSEPVIVEDLRTETRFDGPPLLHEHGVISGLSCIIVGAEKQPWGVLGAHTKSRRRFTHDDTAFLQTVANVLGGVIQRKGAEQQFRLAVEAAPNGMVMADEHGTILMVNSQTERLFNYSRAEMIGQSIEMLLPERYRTAHPGQRQTFFRSPEARAMGHGRDLFARRKDGSEFPVEVGLNPAETPEGKVVLAAVIDITQRKRMEAELAGAHEELAGRARNLEVMVADRTAHLQQIIAELEGISYSLWHDMRAPLRAIHSFLEIVLAEAGAKLDAGEKELLHKAIRAAARLDRLIQDVLTYSRVSRETVTLSEMNVEHLLRQIIDERPEFQPPNAEVEIRAPLGTVRGHEACLTQCITNLLDNAVKFVPSDRLPRVRIWGETVGNQVRIRFEDNGIGIPQEARGRVFEIFQRAHDQKEYPGTGIGLAIARKSVERMGGSIGFESRIGEGTCFWVQLTGISH